ncbi:MAG: enoyl-CoA hydratase/isomerase family protein [Desulfobacca sp.]|uniref:enoyl-CoA hydratase/isomerase family protein n=1 Tax=Desulfobacca sp. TaxID=2067990 RepID=UPI00404935AA
MTLAFASPVLMTQSGHFLVVTLNRPRVINSLNLEMVRLLQMALEIAKTEGQIFGLLLRGAGERGFCAGADLKILAQAVQVGDPEQADRFFQEEYAVDLAIHQFPKPIIVLADGVTMGGGLGLAAGADLVIATDRTRMALPETRIGFIPDVGATGWLFSKCPPGYPEFLALTGYEIQGPETVRLGLATAYCRVSHLPLIQDALTSFARPLPLDRRAAAALLRSEIAPLLESPPTLPCPLDAWVAQHFQGKQTLKELTDSLSRCSLESLVCREVWFRLGERSPTALALTLKLLRQNESRPLPEVFAAEAKAAAFIVRHPDYLEGIRARLLDKDDQPRWSPPTLEALGPLPVDF